MSGFNDYAVTRDRKRLPIDGQTFEFPDRISAAAGEALLRIQAAATDLGAGATIEAVLAAADLDDDAATLAQSEMLGDTHRALIAAGLVDAIPHVVQTLTAWHVFGKDAAERVWNGLGPTTAPNRTARRATARSTRSPVSTAGTTSPKRKPPAAPRGSAS